MYDITKDEPCMILPRLSHVWYCQNWVIYYITKVESCMLLLVLSHVWHYQCWVMYDIIKAESSMVLSRLSDVWYYQGWVMYDIIKVESCMILSRLSLVYITKLAVYVYLWQIYNTSKMDLLFLSSYLYIIYLLFSFWLIVTLLLTVISHLKIINAK